jgi:hypothetical protein
LAGEATEQLLTARSAVSRTGRWPHRRACMGRRAPQAPPDEDSSASRGQPLGVVAQNIRSWPCLVSLSGPQQHPGSSVRCERPVSTRAMSTRPVSSVRWGRPGVPGVRCPVSASGVRCPVGRPGIWASGVRYPGVPRLRCPNRVSSSSAPMQRAATPRGRPGRGGRPYGIHDRLVVCPSRSLTLEAGAGRTGPTAASAWT